MDFIAEYINILIPFVCGLLFIGIPEKLIRPDDIQFAEKRKKLRNGGLILIGIALVYLTLKIIQQHG